MITASGKLMHQSPLWPKTGLVLIGLLLLTPALNAASEREEGIEKALLSSLSEARGAEEKVVLMMAGDTEAVQAGLEQQGIQPDLIKVEKNPAYYATKLVHRLRRYGELLIIYDDREKNLDDILHDQFFADYRITLDRSFDHLKLVAVVNEFATEAAPDNRIALSPVAKVNHVVTDLELLPRDEGMLVATKRGDVHLIDLAGESETSPHLLLTLDDALEGKGELHQVGESGLIGMALHPAFPDIPSLYLHYNLDLADGRRVARLAAWTLELDGQHITRVTHSSEQVLLDIPQPESNHNGGGLVFDDDGLLYIAVGDGEDGEWVKGRARADSLRGKVLRIDVNRSTGGAAYSIPGDNPLVGDKELPPETFAWGFRNPWRMAFAPDGRLIVGDVGEDVHEEITVVEPGGHHGWPAMEGSSCRLEKTCNPETSIGPVFQYGRDAGMSVTGGEVYEGDQIPWLRESYLFADFSSGRLWSLSLPEQNRLLGREDVSELGRWTVEFTTFAKGESGEVYAGDLRGRIYRLAPLSDVHRQTSGSAVEPKS